jgi:A/G-specific adenine glycosylase
MNWYRSCARDLPWRQTSDPYRIWISEIMLQQTRVATVLPYYGRFLERFPDVRALEQSNDDALLAAWSGLGYYSRARNLKRAAQQMNGSFPESYDEIRSLPGIGEYTAAAIASIAFALPHAAVDGNVLRVLSRVANDGGDIGAAPTRKRLADVAGVLLDRKRPGAFNQALMELGATICLPRNPECGECPICADCAARAQGSERELPVKTRRTDSVHLDRIACIVRRGNQLLLCPRDGGFWNVPELDQLTDARVDGQVGEFHHSITHHRYRYQVVLANIGRKPAGFRWVRLDLLSAIPVTTVAKKAVRLLLQEQS